VQKHDCLNAVTEVKTKLDVALKARDQTPFVDLILGIPHLQGSLSKYENRSALRPEDPRALASTIHQYKQSIRNLHTVATFIPKGFIRVDCSKIKESLLNHCQTWQNRLCSMLHDQAKKELFALHEEFYLKTGMHTRTPPAAARPSCPPYQSTDPPLPVPPPPRAAKIAKEPERIDQYREQRLLLDEYKILSGKIYGDRFLPLQLTYNEHLVKDFDVAVSEEEKELLDKLNPELAAFQAALAQAEEMLDKKKEEFQRQTESTFSSLAGWSGRSASASCH
jgi:dynein heavy chain, axonemal